MEYVDICDEGGRVIGRAPRAEVHASRAWHRGVHLFLFNSRGELLVEKRSAGKDKYPGHWDCSLCGHIPSGSDFDETLRRELREELGIAPGVEKLVLFRMSYGPNDNMINALYRCTYDGPVKPERSEIDEIRWLRPEEAAKLRPLTIWFREMLKWYMGRPSELQIIKIYSPKE